MNRLIDYLNRKHTFYNEQKSKAQKVLEKISIEGYLRVIVRKNGEKEYYLRSARGNKNGKYLKKDQLHVAKAIAERDYNRSIIKCADEWIKWIDHTIRTMPKRNLKDLNIMFQSRKGLFTPLVMSDEDFIKWWESVEYQGKPFKKDDPEIYSEKKERVRSKSEKMIADKLYMMGIPYRYEYPLIFPDNTVCYPDFTLLNVAGRKEILLEHFGRMSDSEYANKVVRKINFYDRNGYQIGKDIFYTFESLNYPLDLRIIERIVNKYIND